MPLGGLTSGIPSLARKAVAGIAAAMLLGTGVYFSLQDSSGDQFFRIDQTTKGLAQSGATMSVSGSTVAILGADRRSPQAMISNYNTRATTGASVISWRPDFDGQINDVYAFQDANGSGVTLDVNIAGTSIFSTLLTTDEREVSSSGASTPFVFAAAKTFSRNDLITVDLDSCGNTANGALCPENLNIRFTTSGATFYPR